MPKRVRPGEWEILYYEVPAALRLKERLAELARRNRRSPTQELIVLLDAALPSAAGQGRTNHSRGATGGGSSSAPSGGRQGS